MSQDSNKETISLPPKYSEKRSLPTDSQHTRSDTGEPEQPASHDHSPSADIDERKTQEYEEYDRKSPNSIRCFACKVFECRRKICKWAKLDRKFKCTYRHFYVEYNACANEYFTNVFYHLDKKGCVRYKWPTFYEVMRGFRLGSDFGTPYLLNTSMNKRSVDGHAVSVDDRLLIRRRVVQGFNPDSTVSKLSFSYCFSTASVCPHMREQISEQDFLQELRDALDLWKNSQMRNGSAYLHGFKYKTVRCTSCPTELVMEYIPTSLFIGELHRHHQKYSLLLCMTRYVDMGRVLVPEEMEWRSLTTWFDPPGAAQMGLPRRPFECKIVPRDQWPCIDLTYMEPISVRFERHLNLRPGWGPYHDNPTQPQLEHPI